MIVLPVFGSNRDYSLSPSKIVAVGLNYREHVKESQAFDIKQVEEPTEPVLFAKTPNVLVGPGVPIVIPAHARKVYGEDARTDYEAELAVIVGKRCRDVGEAEALSYVYGYTCFNDVSQRNIQKSDVSGWFRGKSFDTFGPVGPVVVPAAALPDPQRLVVRSRVNGKIRQEASTADMIFPVATLIAYISSMMTLEEGDLIATGTPSGVGALKDGDTVEIEVEGIGVLSNPVIEEGRR